MNFEGKTFLVTGGTGSFGKTMVKYLLKTDVSQVRIFSRDELKQFEMRNELRDSRVKYYIGDVRSHQSLLNALNGVDFVFHAAALKQVPSCEFYPLEAVQTNILGAGNLVDACSKSGVQKCIMLSTDKAVYPVNAMGQSKALMEKIVISTALDAAMSKTIFCATRYGNVLGSRGSVLPLFVDQIKSGRPLTLTDPNMTRFVMTLDESIELVVHALRDGRPGDIFVKRPEACSVEQLAHAVCKIFGVSPNLKVLGTRQGEKLYETMFTREEARRSTPSNDYYQIDSSLQELDYDKYFSEGDSEVSMLEDYTSHNAPRISDAVLIEKIKSLSLIPTEYQS